MDLVALEEQARRSLDPVTYDYYAGGAGDLETLHANVSAWGRRALRPHVMRDVSTVSTETSILGEAVAAAVLVAPTAFHRLAHPDGERATAQGTAAAGSLMCVSTLATITLEDVAAAAPGAPRWFQLYLHRDRFRSDALIDRAVAAGYRAIVVTVDTAVQGERRGEDRMHFSLPEGMEMANLEVGLPAGERSGLGEYVDRELDPSVTAPDLAALADRCPLPVLVKGVHRGDDAVAAIDAGAAGVIVSNHGGRQLNGAVATADALGEVAAAVAGRAPVLVDGGIRRGEDVVRALALGASAVLVGRPVLWGLATGGVEGVQRVLEGFHAATARAMALCGCRTVDEIDGDLLAPG